MTEDDYIVFIVDDDARVRESLCELLASHEIMAFAFASATRIDPSGLLA